MIIKYNIVLYGRYGAREIWSYEVRNRVGSCKRMAVAMN
jgi:hypothetical protein